MFLVQPLVCKPEEISLKCSWTSSANKQNHSLDNRFYTFIQITISPKRLPIRSLSLNGFNERSGDVIALLGSCVRKSKFHFYYFYLGRLTWWKENPDEDKGKICFSKQSYFPRALVEVVFLPAILPLHGLILFIYLFLMY